MIWQWRKQRTLVDLAAEAIRVDPQDAPVVYLDADLLADDLERYVPSGIEPERQNRSHAASATP